MTWTTRGFRKGLFTIGLLFVLAVTWANGNLVQIYEADPTRICVLLAAMFVGGVGAVWLDRWRAVNWLAEEMLTLGLIGTVVGLIMAFSGLDPSTSASVTGAKAMVETLVAGMGVALYTTLVGAVGYLTLSGFTFLFGETNED